MGFGTLVQRITYKISGRSTSSSGLYVPSTDLYDYAVGGVPFLSATSDVRPDTEQPVEQRKQQFDNYKDPGEYSLNQWWLRSQTSFIGGAGIIYQDPDTQGEPKNLRFNKSVGIDPFSDPDNIQLLHEMQNLSNISADPNNGVAKVLGSVSMLPGDTTPVSRMWVAKGKTVLLTNVDVSTLNAYGSATLTTSSASFGITSDITEIGNTAVSPQEYYLYVFVTDTTVANAGIWKVKAASGAMTATRVYQPPAIQANITMNKARGLLAFAQANALYMLDPYAAPNTALPGTPNAVVPKDQIITAITDGPDGIYVSANNSTQGYIYRTTFDPTTGVVNGLTLTAVMPYGERINYINAYVNTYLLISTTSGIRVGNFTTGAVIYGTNILPVPVTGLAVGPEGSSGFGRSVFYGTRAYVTELGTPQHDGDYGLVAVDLGTLIVDNSIGATINPYCSWTFFAGTPGSTWSVAVAADGRTVFTSNTNSTAKLFLESGFSYMQTGYLDTGRCRFNTTEPKLFKFLSIKTPSPLEGEVSITVLSEGGGVTPYVTYGPTFGPGVDDISTPTPTGPQNFLALRFTLRRGAVAFNKTGKLDAWQIKALPGTIKQRLITRQFLCFNSEKDKSGQVISGDTMSLDRLTAVEQMCQRGDTVTYQDLVNNIATQVIIDTFKFTMLASPGPNGENYGGYLTVNMRTVADSVPPISNTGGGEADGD
jgi:hypothetical protein